MEKRANGDDVPIPTSPPLFTVRAVALEEPTENIAFVFRAEVGFTERKLQGVDELIPTCPMLFTRNKDDVALILEEAISKNLLFIGGVPKSPTTSSCATAPEEVPIAWIGKVDVVSTL